MKDSQIEWTHHTFNPWIGCTKVSPGCLHCYAETQNVRWHNGKNWGKGKPRHRTSHSYCKQPLKWARDSIGKSSRPERVFCASLADWLDDEVPIQWLDDLFNLIRLTPNLNWLLLTKRPQNWRSRVMKALSESLRIGDVQHECWLQGWLWLGDHPSPPSNVWIGTSVEDQARADERIPFLFSIPARVRFLSCEPQLEPIDLQRASKMGAVEFGKKLHWVICGGESGPSKRYFNPDWARSLRDQCAASGTTFFMKQIDKVQPIPDDLMIRQFPA
jgi:protein gp37